jgi:type II secretory pathway component GspD/PulD (secretin)
VKFQNTQTTRYRDLEINPDTSELQSTGVTRELSSGLILTLEGWVSGDGMITIAVTATVSEQGATSSTDSNMPPATTERVVNTELRTYSGEPVTITGLVQRKNSNNDAGFPLLKKIPVLGNLFTNKNKIEEEIEMVIYVVPRVVNTLNTVTTAELTMNQIYTDFLKR